MDIVSVKLSLANPKVDVKKLVGHGGMVSYGLRNETRQCGGIRSHRTE